MIRSDDCAAAIEAFRAKPDPRTTLISEALDFDSYTQLLHSADVALLPYHHDIYEARTSGVFIEASALGKIVLATADTWMADYVDAYKHGLLVKDRSARDLMQAFEILVAHYPQIAERARSAAGQFRTVHNPDNLLEHVLGGAGISAVPPRVRRAAIFYPWGDITGRTGAASRRQVAGEVPRGDRPGRTHSLFRDENLTLGPGITAEGCAIDNSQLKLLRTNTKLFISDDDKSNSDVSIHLFLHFFARVSDEFRRKCLRLIRWTDDIFVEYAYFAELIKELAAPENKTVTVTLHDLVSETARGMEPTYGIIRAMELAGLRGIEHVVISSETEARICEQQGIPVTVIPHPIDQESLRSYDTDVVEGILSGVFGIPLTGRTICLFVGSGYDPNRSAARAIRAMAARSASDFRLQSVIYIVAGAAHDVERYDNFIALGRVEDMTLEVLYQAATVVLVPLLHGTGMSVKTVEAFARGSAVISTRVGMRGFPVVDGEHCLIEDDIERFPDRIADLLQNPVQLARLRECAAKFGLAYDYRILFQRYSIASILGSERHIRDVAPALAEFIERFEEGGGTREGLQWLLRRIDYSTLDLSQLAGLTKSCHRLLPHDPSAQMLLYTIEQRTPVSIREALTKWSILYRLVGPGVSRERFINDLVPVLHGANNHAGMREQVWGLFNAGEDDLTLWLGRGIMACTGGLNDPELAYVFALVSDRNGGHRGEAIQHLTMALDMGFDPAWTRFHRGRLLLSEGDPAGRAEVEYVLSLGGDAAVAAETLLAADSVSALWRSFHAGDHATVVRLAEKLLAAGATDPVVPYVLGMSLHASGSRLGDARNHYDTALEMGFDPAWTRFHRGRLLLSEGDPAGRADLEHVLSLGGDAAVAAETLLAADSVTALWRSFHTGDHATVVRLAEKLLAAGATDPVVHYVLGMSLHASGSRLGDARNHYDTALEMGFDPAWTRFHRGRLRLALGDREGGLTDLRRAVALGGDAGREAEQRIASESARDRQDQTVWNRIWKSYDRLT